MYKDYNMNQLVLPLEIEYIIPKTDIAHTINEFVESMPGSVFENYYKTEGRPSYHPKMMLKIILCAYTQATFSGRRIEAMLQDSIRMMWLSQGQTPSYRTINRFRVSKTTSELLEQCYIQFRSRLLEEALIDEKAIYIDGTKIEAAAQKYTFVWKKAVQTNETKMIEKATEMYQTLVKENILPAIAADELITTEEMQQMEQKLEEKVTTLTEEMATTNDTTERKRIRSERTPRKKQLKTVKEMNERTERYKEHYEILGDRNSYSKTDHDATFMRMKDDHMQNGQLKAGYNLQIATTNQYILGYDIYPNPTDMKTFIPFLNTLKTKYQMTLPTHIVADAGYGSEMNYEHIYDELERTPLITYTMYNKELTRKHKKNEFHIDNWEYHEQDDTFICPNNQQLEFKRYKTTTDTHGYERNFKEYRTEACCTCPLRESCTTSKKETWNKVISKNMKWEYFKHEMKRMLSEPETGDLYRQRKIDVEPVFGHLKAILGFTRMSVRGKDKVRNELGIALMAINLRKYQKSSGFNSMIGTEKGILSNFFITLNSFSIYLRAFVPDSSH